MNLTDTTAVPIMVQALQLSERLSESNRYKEEVIARLVNSHPLIQRAWQTALFYHRGIDHRRKYTNDCYENHLLETCIIASIIAPRFKSFFETIVCDDLNYLQVLFTCLLLHDVIEDTPCTFASLEEKFPAEIVFLVRGMTDADFRRRLNWKHLPLSRNREVRLLCKIHKLDASVTPPDLIGRRDTHLLLHFAKLCDLISNTCSIVKYDQKFAPLYLAEKCLVLDKLFYFLVQHHSSDFYDSVQENLINEVWTWLAEICFKTSSEDLRKKARSMNEFSRHAVSDLVLFENFKNDLTLLTSVLEAGLIALYKDEPRRQKICGF